MRIWVNIAHLWPTTVYVDSIVRTLWTINHIDFFSVTNNICSGNIQFIKKKSCCLFHLVYLIVFEKKTFWAVVKIDVHFVVKKLFREKTKAEYFPHGSTFFPRFGHIDRLLSYFMNVSSFLFLLLCMCFTYLD